MEEGAHIGNETEDRFTVKLALGLSQAEVRMACATGHLLTGTSSGACVYLGTHAGHHVAVTNHHMCSMPGICRAATTIIVFPLLGITAHCRDLLGTWKDIDLSLLSLVFESRQRQVRAEQVAARFAFHIQPDINHPLITFGFGGAARRRRPSPFATSSLVVAHGDTCTVFSDTGEYRYLVDPDQVSPNEYSVWSFAHGCNTSHGNSGGPVCLRGTADLVGLTWTGRTPKPTSVCDKRYLACIMASQDERIWSELSYAVPATRIRDTFLATLCDASCPPRLARVLCALLASSMQ
jgi:hypothetical protein